MNLMSVGALLLCYKRPSSIATRLPKLTNCHYKIGAALDEPE